MATELTPQKPIQPLPEFAGLLPDQEPYAIDEADEFSNRINSWFDRLMIQSGMEMAPSMILSLCVLAGITFGGTIFVLQENLLTTAAMFFVGFFAPIAVALVLQARRLRQMTLQLPAMIDELARAAKTGRSLEQCFQMVAEDTPDPLGNELMRCARKTQMGMDLSETLRHLPERTGLVTLNIFVMALTVHHQTGGDIVSVLERLSQTVRDRLLFLGRLRANTITGRAAAVVMISIPPAVLLFFMVRDPNYLQSLLSSPWGRGLTFLAVGLEIVGAILILRILKNTQRA